SGTVAFTHKVEDAKIGHAGADLVHAPAGEDGKRYRRFYIDEEGLKGLSLDERGSEREPVSCLLCALAQRKTDLLGEQDNFVTHWRPAGNRVRDGPSPPSRLRGSACARNRRPHPKAAPRR